MDQAVAAALTAVQHPDNDSAERWFELLCRSYQALDEAGQGWPELVTELTAQWPSATDVETFQLTLEAQSDPPWETIGRLTELGSELPALYLTETAVPAPEEAPAAAVDLTAWHAFLAENGPHWNGTEAAWQQFRDWFVYHAEAQGLLDPATGFLTEVESSTDKAAIFARHGVAVPAAQPAPVDENAWRAYLTENGPHWNGTEAAWQQFRDWFLYHADAQGLLAPATDFLTEAEQSADKAAVFAHHGIAVPAAAEADVEPADAPDAEAAEVAAAPAAFDPRAFSWVTPDQVSALDDLAEVRGDWHDWLASDLDGRRPDWTELPQSELPEWLDGLLPFLVLPDSEQELAETMAAFTADIAADEVFQELIEDFTDEELDEIIAAALSPDEAV